MIGFRTTTEDETKRIIKATDKAQFRNFGHASARIAKDAKASIERSARVPGTRRHRVPSPPGSPPKTRLVPGQNLRGAIRYDANKDGALIGPMFSFIGTVGEAHEFGIQYKGDRYPQRPFMGPALSANLPRFAADWAGSIGE